VSVVLPASGCEGRERSQARKLQKKIEGRSLGGGGVLEAERWTGKPGLSMVSKELGEIYNNQPMISNIKHNQEEKRSCREGDVINHSVRNKTPLSAW